MNKQQKRTVKRHKNQPTKGTFDAFGGRIGTRMSAINLVVIKAGKKGATVQEVATATGEASEIVSAQLGWMVNHKKVATRKAEKNKAGKSTFRYFAKSKQKGATK